MGRERSAQEAAQSARILSTSSVSGGFPGVWDMLGSIELAWEVHANSSF